ncbi:PGF-pre-PGF domain-containing protein, partial [Candidatus Woesearchaeota archaeon]|nr:PGF-pre-PGF domain-containing protein [Candidatus Woesearchaeota archaeon]
GPAQAITIGMDTRSDTTPDEQSAVTFRVYVDFAIDELVPVQNLTLTIGSESCVFNISGVEISGDLCNDVTITKNRAVEYGSGTLWGYGSNLTSGNYNYTFGTGFGYGYSSTYVHELDYNVSWTTPDVESDTAYDVTLAVNAYNTGSTPRTYSKTMSSFFTVEYVAPTTTRTSSGGGVTIPTTATTISNILAGSSATFDLSKSKTGITSIKIDARYTIPNAQIRVTEGIKPFGASVAISSNSGKVYKYIDIKPTGFDREDIDGIKIKFSVPITWFIENELSPNSIVLKHYVDGRWVSLPTTLDVLGMSEYSFSAETDWFSTFAITARKGSPTLTGQTVGVPDTIDDISEPINEVVDDEVIINPPVKTDSLASLEKEGIKISKKALTTGGLIIFLVFITGAIIFMMVEMSPKKPSNRLRKVHHKSRKKSKPKGKHPLDEYVELVKKKGFARQEVKRRLVDEGWDEITVEHHLNKHYKNIK